MFSNIEEPCDKLPKHLCSATQSCFTTFLEELKMEETQKLYVTFSDF